MSQVKFVPLALLAAAALGACSGLEIELRADDLAITAGGLGSTAITARVVRMGEPEPNATVKFETTAGSFDEAAVEDSRAVTTNAQGEATIELHSGRKQTTATVTASYDDEVSRVTATSSLSVDFVAAAGDDLPQGGLLALRCDAVNIAALGSNAHNIRVGCTLNGKTADQRPIKTGALSPQLFAEAGSLVPGEDERTGARILVYSPESDGLTPVQVKPDDDLGEPRFIDQFGQTHNPRDGLVTLTAVVDGREGFVDTNGNGRYDLGELFHEVPEPFLDANDNRTRDESEAYVDTNGNGQWDPENDRYDAQTKIMAMFKILWTGPPHVDGTLDPPGPSRIALGGKSTALVDGASLELKAVVLDSNLNPVAAFGEDAGDELEWQVSSDGDAQACSETRQPMENGYGFSFRGGGTVGDETELQRWRIRPGSFGPLRNHALTLCDTRAGDDAPARKYTVTAVVHTSAGHDDDGRYLPQREHEVGVVKGTGD